MSHIFSLQCAFHACAWICFCFCFWFGLVFWVPSFCHTNAGIHQKIHFPESTTSYTHGNHRLQSSRPHSPGTFTLPWILNQCLQPQTHSIYTYIYEVTHCALTWTYLAFWFSDWYSGFQSCHVSSCFKRLNTFTVMIQHKHQYSSLCMPTRLNVCTAQPEEQAYYLGANDSSQCASPHIENISPVKGKVLVAQHDLWDWQIYLVMHCLTAPSN